MIFTMFHSVSKAYIEDMRDVVENLKWEEFVELLCDRQNVDKKEDGKLYNLALFKRIGDPTALLGRKKIFKHNEWTGEYKYFDNTVRRCKDNLVAISGILLDFDKDVKIEDVMKQYEGVEYVLYTTFNHTFDHHRFRVVIPFTTPLKFEDIELKKESIKETFKGVDDASFSASQSFYFHAGKNDPICFHNKGYIINPYTDFENGIVKEDNKVVKNFTSAFELSPEYQKRIVESLESCKGLRYPNALTLVAICKTYGLGFNDFNNICGKISDNDSSLMKIPHCRKDLWNSEYDKITSDKRDKFIKDHGGRPISKKIEKHIEYKKDFEEMELIKKIIRMKKDGK